MAGGGEEEWGNECDEPTNDVTRTFGRGGVDAMSTRGGGVGGRDNEEGEARSVVVDGIGGRDE